ncbi:MAG: hypothetical protein IKG11_00470 [Atopobiaceae bacterium]|nr:hypothetical protein [Atopobiaceae bacterium]
METGRSENRRKVVANSPNKQRRSSSDGRKPLQGRDTGYRVGSSRRQSSSRNINPRLIIAGVAGILVIIALIFGVTSCVKGCSSSKGNKKEDKVEQVNPDDARVAYGVNAEVTKKLAPELDRDETFAKIAKSADKITDERLIDLAIAEPEAVDFVYGSIKAKGTSQPYGENVTTGDFPVLYTFDERWGYLPYADGIAGVTASGPVAVSMASMGLSGKNNYDPATIIQAVAAANLASGTTGMDDSFITNHAADAGLAATTCEASSDGIYSALSDGAPVLIKLKADSGIGSESAHWALITQLNSDGSITVNDPTSAVASSHTWSLGAVSSKADTAYSLEASSGSSSSSGSKSSSSDSDDEEDYSGYDEEEDE